MAEFIDDLEIRGEKRYCLVLDQSEMAHLLVVINHSGKLWKTPMIPQTQYIEKSMTEIFDAITDGRDDTDCSDPCRHPIDVSAEVRHE